MANPIDREGRELAVKINQRLVAIRADIEALQAAISGVEVSEDAVLAALGYTPADAAAVTSLTDALNAKADLSGAAFTGPVDMIGQTLNLSDGTLFGGSMNFDFQGGTQGNLWSAIGLGGTVGHPEFISLKTSAITSTGALNITAPSYTLSAPAALRSAMGLGAAALSNQDVSTGASPTFAGSTITAGTANLYIGPVVGRCAIHEGVVPLMRFHVSYGTLIGTNGIAGGSDVAGVDVMLSRISAGWWGVGTTTKGGFSGSIKMTDLECVGGITLGAKTVGTLPTASANTYKSYIVPDANAPALGATVASGGSAKAGVRSNGTNWIVTEIL